MGKAIRLSKVRQVSALAVAKFGKFQYLPYPLTRKFSFRPSPNQTQTKAVHSLICSLLIVYIILGNCK